MKDGTMMHHGRYCHFRFFPFETAGPHTHKRSMAIVNIYTLSSRAFHARAVKNLSSPAFQERHGRLMRCQERTPEIYGGQHSKYPAKWTGPDPGHGNTSFLPNLSSCDSYSQQHSIQYAVLPPCGHWHLRFDALRPIHCF